MIYVKIKEHRKGKKDIEKGLVYFDTKENALKYLQDYIIRDTNYIDIKMLGNEKMKIVKFNYDLILEIIEE